MKLLVGKTFGLGNAIMSISMIKSLKSLNKFEQIDVLIGSTTDDGGTFDVFKYLKNDGIINDIHVDFVKNHQQYDVAIMSIPFDGRWHNGVHFNAKQVLDGRTRPDPSTTGLVSWKKHEVLYQMDTAEKLGYSGDVPSMSFYKHNNVPTFIKDVYLGVGYKKDAAGFWSKKHWGNLNYSLLIKKMLAENPDSFVWSTGDVGDFQHCLKDISYNVANTRFVHSVTNLDKAFDRISKCGLYVGNDTGAMHVAASMNIPCISMFFLENSIVKSKPWGNNHVVVDGFNRTVSVDEVYEIVKDKFNVAI